MTFHHAVVWLACGWAPEDSSKPSYNHSWRCRLHGAVCAAAAFIKGEKSIAVCFSPYNFSAHATPMPGDATLFVILLIVGIFAADIIRRWWRETEWKRRWRRDRDDHE